MFSLVSAEVQGDGSDIAGHERVFLSPLAIDFEGCY